MARTLGVKPLTIESLDRIKRVATDFVREARTKLRHCRYADLRLEVIEVKSARAENGVEKSGQDDYVFGFGVRVLAGDPLPSPGYFGHRLGNADLPRLTALLRDGLRHAYDRAIANARHKNDARTRFKGLGDNLAGLTLAPIEVRQDTVKAEYAIDPRSVPLSEVARHTAEASRAVKGLGSRIRFNAIATSTSVSRELFTNSEGAVVDQSFATTLGFCSVVAASDTAEQSLFDYIGHQRGWEVVTEGTRSEFVRHLDLLTFSTSLGRDCLKLVDAPPLRATDKEVVVVTDPHYNALKAHEIIGHPTELDRALKMETAYAGRSWFLRSLKHMQIGKQVASPLVTAYSDPSLPGLGHYAYDHEGTPARKVVHIDKGIFTGFMNSRQTAAILKAEPNGSYKATEASMVPLIRMSNTVFAAGPHDPDKILDEVDRGYYLVGHRTPSIAESRENFSISAQKVYEIRNGQIGQLYRGGGMTADTKDYLMKVDAVGRDFRLTPIPNCGKGQPMQTKRLGNGAPTMRSRARLTGV
ncbi:MAG: TldD/PmbA family protein [Nitrospirae bacterium]|nr:TldD/PmbA family protein [Nitrospirota bacterium]